MGKVQPSPGMNRTWHQLLSSQRTGTSYHQAFTDGSRNHATAARPTNIRGMRCHRNTANARERTPGGTQTRAISWPRLSPQS